MAPHSQPVEEVFESDFPRAHPFSAEQAANIVHARKWDAKVDRQITLAHERSRLASDEYLEDIMQHARHMEVGLPPPLNSRPPRVIFRKETALTPS